MSKSAVHSASNSSAQSGAARLLLLAGQLQRQGHEAAAATMRGRAYELQRQGDQGGAGRSWPVPASSWPAASDQGQQHEADNTAVQLPSRVRTYAGLNVAMLQQDAPVWRVALLLKAYDQEGRGVIERGQARQLLTAEDSPWRIFTWRRLRQIIGQGRGVCWNTGDQGEIYLFGPARILANLGAGRLGGKPVYIPTSELLQGMHQANAALFTSHHAGRRDNAPISRQALRTITGVAESTQRTYDKTAGTKRQANIATGQAATQEARQEAAWQHGRAAFTMRVKGQEVTAWQLPSSYEARYEQAPKGRQRRINQRLNLVTKGRRGNRPGVDRRYYPTAHAAAKAAGRGQGDQAHYWRGARVLTVTASVPTRLKGARIWHAIA